MARITGTNGDDTIHGSERNDEIRAENGDDWVDAGNGDDTVRGGAGDDTLIGGAGADRLFGGSGGDILMGDGPNVGGGSGSGSGSGRGSGSGSGSGRGSGSGSGSHGRGSGSGSHHHHGSGSGSHGGSGSAEVSFNDYLNGGSGNDTLLGQLGDDTLKGGSGNDSLDGGVGRDHVDGDSGDDVGLFVGGENGGRVDWYDGGTGSDTLIISLTPAQFADAGIFADLVALNEFIAANADVSTDSGAKQTFNNLGIRVQDWEDLTVLVDGEPVDLSLDPLFTEQPDTVDFDDVQAGTYEDGTQYDALASDDTVTFASSQGEANQAGYDTDETFSGGGGDDTLTGRGLDDRIAGGADDDTIDGGAGDDLIYGDNVDSAGEAETFVATGNQQGWNDAGVTLTAYDFDGTDGTVTYDGDGVGVAGGSPVGNQINHSSDGSSEMLVAEFDSPAVEATVTVARMFATENGGEQGAWEAFDTHGNSVGSGTFGPEITGGGNVGSFTISGIGEFSEIRFTGREYADGTPPGAGDSSDYYVQTIEYTTVGESEEGGDDVIVGGVGDDVVYGQGGDDIIDGDAPASFVIEDVLNDDGCFDISGACDITITADFLSSLAGYDNSFGYYLAGADGLPVSGEIIFADVKNSGPGVGDEVTISLDSDALAGATKIGFFIIPNGENLNPGMADGDDVTFAESGGDWTVISDGSPLAGQGAGVFFSNEALNPGGFDHEEDVAVEGNQNWEDIVNGGDGDHNDVNLNVSVQGTFFRSGIEYDGADASGTVRAMLPVRAIMATAAVRVRAATVVAADWVQAATDMLRAPAVTVAAAVRVPAVTVAAADRVQAVTDMPRALAVTVAAAVRVQAVTVTTRAPVVMVMARAVRVRPAARVVVPIMVRVRPVDPIMVRTMVRAPARVRAASISRSTIISTAVRATTSSTATSVPTLSMAMLATIRASSWSASMAASTFMTAARVPIPSRSM